MKSISIQIPVGLVADVHDLATLRGEEPIPCLCRCIRIGIEALRRPDISATQMCAEVAALADSLDGRR